MVVPQAPDQGAHAAQPSAYEANCAHHRPVRLSWARLLKRVFELDLEHCPNCGGELKIIAAILERPVIEQGSPAVDPHDRRISAVPSTLSGSQWTPTTPSSAVGCRARGLMAQKEVVPMSPDAARPLALGRQAA